MATEVLAVPEEHLRDAIKVIRAGLETVPTTGTGSVAQEVREHLADWCAEEEEYLDRLGEDDDEELEDDASGH